MLGHIWSDKSIISVIRCGTPSDGILADKAWTDDILGSVVSYTCHISARRISGDLSRTCLDTRIWNGTVLECQGKRLDKRLDSICVCTDKHWNIYCCLWGCIEGLLSCGPVSLVHIAWVLFVNNILNTYLKTAIKQTTFSPVFKWHETSHCLRNKPPKLLLCQIQIYNYYG